MRKKLTLILLFVVSAAFLRAENRAQVSDDNFYYKLYTEYAESDPEKAAGFAKMHLDRVDSLSFTVREADLLQEMARYYDEQRCMFSRSIELLSRAVDFYVGTGMEKEAASCYLMLADLNRKIHNYDRTLEYCNLALQYYKRDEDENAEEILVAYNLLGIVHIICNDTQTARKYFQDQSNLSVKANDRKGLVLALNNLASIGIKEGDTIECETLLKEAVALSAGNQKLQFRSLRNLAAYYYIIDSLPVFNRLLDSLSACAVKIDEKAECHYLSGVAKLAAGDTSGVIREYQLALEEYMQGEFKWKQKKLLYELNLIYEELGDIEKAYYYLSQYNKIDTNTDEKMFQRLFSYQNSLDLQKERAEQNSRKAQLTNLIVIVVSVCFLLLLVATVIYVRKYYRILKKEKELDNKEMANDKISKEINTKQYVIEKRRLQEFKDESVINTIYENLKDLNADISDPETKRRLNVICKDVIRLRGASESEDTLDKGPYLPEFNPELMKNLSASFPNLSMNERRLCALLSLNMSTKEISDITKQSLHSINVSRYRLRKKLGINNSDISIHKFLDKYN